MTVDGFSLAATTNDLGREPDAREAADLLEFRMDSANDPIEQLADYDGELPILATNRSQWAGGHAEDQGRLDALMTAAEFDAVELVDVELETARGTEWVVDEFRDQDVELVISFHDFDATPDRETLDAIIEECAEYGDIAKFATQVEDRRDCLRILSAIESATRDGIRTAGMGMGKLGSHTRVVAPLYGSALGYAPLASDSSEYAPGQLPLRELRSLVETLETGAVDDGVLEGL
ncbi:type I 3-dehydroquinate dehydratase [Haloterrigena salifodinae]|uniref:3-dehydroquinate dehydratase n=1 Tax=Haloterrigena salifodinae TaxID=2675099 RepID=A0A8T8E4A3_9EURY|nr:type I 3-dehydroquinate dehydratase [Haloterrigena salifodinae]QRV16221.1 type I 3-dehydroquinate dehydratase [Haloterrigena salifodinae]